MLPERDRVFIAQMLEAATAALDFTEGLTKETVCSDRLIGMRNVVVHDYADVDLSLVWKTVRDDLPGLSERLGAILAESD
jgi:uncharacterized protein with HEPN domain